MNHREINTNEPKKMWKQANNPYRSLVFWGWNLKNEPSFLILYGAHKFVEEKSYFVGNSDIERFENVLCDEVTYNSYAVFNGMEGHLPSFEAVNIIESGGYHYRGNRDEFPKMYYKKDSRYDGWSRNLIEDGIVKEYVKFDKGCGVTIPYFEDFSYEELVQKVKDSHLTFENFKFAENPNEILKLSEKLKDYYELLCVMMSDKNLYTRKKKLKELIESSPEPEVYQYIFKLGSTELISGLLLECAKRNIASFISEAEYICKENIHYSSDSYVKGLKRCAEIYLNAVIKERRALREKWIYEHLSEVDLHLIKIDGKEIPEDKVLNGARYRKLAYQEKLKVYSGYYEQAKDGSWNFVKVRVEDRYKKGPFNDGVVFDINAFKNLLQEAEAYQMANVIGTIAYYLDAPRIHYYFMGNTGLSRILKYFKRYVRRIIEDYGTNNPDKFMEVMKVLLTSYTEHDYLCKFKGNFQFNYFIKNILYSDFKEKPPIGWDNWEERESWMQNDQLLALQGRHELVKEVWDTHLEDVLYIVANAKINTVLKACYFILKESSNVNELYEKMTYEALIKSATSSYEPLSKMFMEVIESRLSSEENFDFQIMLAFINSKDERMNKLGMDYFHKTNGYLKSSDIVQLMLSDNLEKWTEYIIENINAIKSQDYGDFVKAIIQADEPFKSASFELPEVISDALSASVSKVTSMLETQKHVLLKDIINCILEKGAMESFIESFLEEVVFELSYEEIKQILQDVDLNYKNKVLSSRNNMILNLLDSIFNHKLPSDHVIIKILETGTSKILKTLFEIVNINENQLIESYSTLLILLESDVVSLNEKAKEIFRKMSEASRIKMHKMIIDSPVQKVYEFGLEELKDSYGTFIPSDFIMQMLEHPSPYVKGYMTNQSEHILKSLGQGNEALFIYYAKTLLLLPNKVRKNKEDIYHALYRFALQYKERQDEVERLLLDIGGSNIIKDQEAALVTLAKIRKEAAV